MPRSFLMNGTIPVVMIAERTRSTVRCASAMESGKTAVTQHSVQDLTVGRRADRNIAYACHEFVIGRQVVIFAGTPPHVIKNLSTMQRLMFLTVPRGPLEPFVMRNQLLVEVFEMW